MTTDQTSPSFLAAPSGTTTTSAAPTAEQRIAELEAKLAALAPAAARGEQALAAERAQLDAKVARLSQADRETVARLSEADRAAVVDRLLAAPGAFRMPPVIGGGPPAPAGPAVDIPALLAQGRSVGLIKDQHPREFAAYIDSIRPEPKPVTQASQFLGLQIEKQRAAAARGHRR